LEKAVFEIPSDSQSFPSAHSLHSMILWTCTLKDLVVKGL
jgi:hypothetical protein